MFDIRCLNIFYIIKLILIKLYYRMQLRQTGFLRLLFFINGKHSKRSPWGIMKKINVYH
jgi:hypothetical protein